MMDRRRRPAEKPAGYSHPVGCEPYQPAIDSSARHNQAGFVILIKWPAEWKLLFPACRFRLQKSLPAAIVMMR